MVKYSISQNFFSIEFCRNLLRIAIELLNRVQIYTADAFQSKKYNPRITKNSRNFYGIDVIPL